MVQPRPTRILPPPERLKFKNRPKKTLRNCGIKEWSAKLEKKDYKIMGTKSFLACLIQNAGYFLSLVWELLTWWLPVRRRERKRFLLSQVDHELIKLMLQDIYCPKCAHPIALRNIVDTHTVLDRSWRIPMGKFECPSCGHTWEEVIPLPSMPKL